MHNTRKVLKECLRILISFMFVAGSAYFLRGRWGQSLTVLGQVNLPLFLFALFLFVVINGLVAFRLLTIMQAEKLAPSAGRVIYLSFVSLFFNLFLPSSLGGDVVKAYYLGRDCGSSVKAISAVFVDRLVGLTTLVIVAFLALPFFITTFSDWHLPGVVLIIFLVFFFIIIILLNEKFARKFKFITHFIPTEIGKQRLTQLYQAIAQYRHSRSALIAGFFISIMVQLLSISVGYLILNSLAIEIPFLTLFLILPVTGIASMAPSLGGLGVREATLIYFISRYTTPEHAAAFALANDILIYGFGLICGILYALVGGLRQHKATQIHAHDR